MLSRTLPVQFPSLIIGARPWSAAPGEPLDSADLTRAGNTLCSSNQASCFPESPPAFPPPSYLPPPTTGAPGWSGGFRTF